ncbi:MAG: hypothetical protein Q8L78_01960 [Coxiellaceae bacterium]|nr:hypothetical protein [Coxiellaceae bacterium]
MLKKIVLIIKNKISLTFFLIKNYYCHRTVYYRLSSVDVKAQTAILHVINKSIFIKQTFSEIISNSNIIEGLSCEHASRIGIYYGESLRRSVMDEKTHLKHIKKPGYLLKHEHGRYKVVGENRDGTIECVHVKTKNILSAYPLSIVKDKIFINYFDVNQACYIGILAGIGMEKSKKTVFKEVKKQSVNYLRIVK